MITGEKSLGKWINIVGLIGQIQHSSNTESYRNSSTYTEELISLQGLILLTANTRDSNTNTQTGEITLGFVKYATQKLKL